MKTYLRHRILNVVDVKELFALEYLDFEGKYKNYSEKHNFFEMCFVLDGEITLKLDGDTSILSRGELILIEPNAEHSYLSLNGNRNRVFVVCFASPSIAVRSLAGRRFSLTRDQEYFLNKIIEESAGTFWTNEKDLLELLPTPNFGGQQVILLIIEYLLIDLIRQSSEEKNPSIVFLNGKNFYPDLVELIKGYLEKNIGKRLTLDSISEKFNYSRSFICKIFKEHTGESLITYFNRIKIEHAKQILEQSERSISEISELLAFSEPKYFCSIFKKQVNLSPAAYREMVRKTEKGDQNDTDCPW